MLSEKEALMQLVDVLIHQNTGVSFHLAMLERSYSSVLQFAACNCVRVDDCEVIH